MARVVAGGLVEELAMLSMPEPASLCLPFFSPAS